MLTVNLSFGPHFEYRNEFVELPGHPQQLTITLIDGTHIFESENFDIGTFHAFGGRKILGHFTFKYTYDEKTSIVTVCGTDYDSSDTMSLITVPEGTSEYCRQRATPGGFAIDDVLINPHWNYRTPLMPGLEDVLRRITRSANESLIAALESSSGLIVQVRKHPPELSPEQHRQLLAVYRDEQFVGLYEQGRDYGSHVVVTIESVFGGEVTFNSGEFFANVIGSTNDPKIAGQSWLNLWYNQMGVYPTVCTSYQFGNFPCGNSLVGGHVITGKVAKMVPMGSNSVYIFPICIQHNNDDSVFMSAGVS